MISNMLRFPFPTLSEELRTNSQQRAEATYPAINIGTTDNSVDVYLFVPGINTEKLELVIEKNMLSISGHRQLPDIDNEKGSSYRQERFEGAFKRVITLPDTVDTDTTQAVYSDGVLHISIAKREETQPRKIEISVAH